ncbi:MAG: YajQ family cyclic di-GMP-binding protein [Candidatus Palauibacterales bacterium]|nr:YajQ family cyclic di-GMP-binding protein [Candidatus Palauibacterales bacterium]MDP2483888.1 YajQ family cyclic di-GMP-binding protein [Candidatus Palauibacterales bacterium]
MAKTSSFDVSTGVDLQEVDNAINQARKEVAQRYDFKGTNCTLQFERSAASVTLEADDTYRLQALGQVLREKLSRRKVPLKNLDESKIEEGSLGRARQTIGFKQGIDQETGKKISKDIRGGDFKKVQVQIQGDELRVIAPSKDTLQEVMAFLRTQDYGVELAFGNYR